MREHGIRGQKTSLPNGNGMFWLAWKTMFHEKVRLALAVTGIAFSTILVLAQVGIYIGMVKNAVAVITHTDADIWIASKNIRNVDFGVPFPEERVYRVRSLPEVLWARRLIVYWGYLKLANGGQEQVEIIGFNPNTGFGAPWRMIEGGWRDVKGGRYLIMDKTSEKRIGKLKVGSIWELDGKRFELVGISDGLKSFTTAPVVCMTFNELQNLSYGAIKPGETTYIAAKLRDKSESRKIAKILRARLKNNDVMTRDDFIMRTIRYWTIQTGIGMSIFLTAFLGLMIGGAIVGQTIYSNTMQHMKEYGTLKAMGATNRDIYRTIFSQAGINAAIGYAVGAISIMSAKGVVEKAGVPLYTSAVVFIVIFFMIGAASIMSAWFSVKKIKTIDPVMVFKG